MIVQLKKEPTNRHAECRRMISMLFISNFCFKTLDNLFELTTEIRLSNNSFEFINSTTIKYEL